MKGQSINSQLLIGGALAVIAVVIALSVGSQVTSTIQDQQLKKVNTRVNNESIVFVYGGLYNLTNTPVQALIEVLNNSAGTMEVIGSGNYTQSGNSINLSFTTVTNFTINISRNVTVNLTSPVIEILDAYNSTGTRFTSGNITVDCAPNSGCNKINHTSGALIETGTRASGGLVNVTWRYVRYNNTRLNVTYDYEKSVYTEAYNISGKGLDAYKTYADWFTIIVVVVVAAAIIVVMLRGFSGRRSFGV